MECNDIVKIKRPVPILDFYKLVAVKYTVEYTVRKLGLDGKTLHESPVFHVGQQGEHHAKIMFFCNGGCPFFPCRGIGCTYIQFLSEDKIKSKIRRQICLSFIKEQKTHSFFSRSAMTVYYENCNPTWGWCNGAKHPSTNTNDWFDNDCLTIVCDITLLLEDSGEFGISEKDKIPQNKLVEDMNSLLGNQDLSDVKLAVGDKSCQAHKLILSARSPVFARMFQTQMSESILNVVEVTDMEFEVLQSLVVYMYTDNVPDIDKLAESLLSAAEKYQLDGLKEKCEEFLGKSLTVENSVGIFLLAHLHRANFLKAKAVNFIKKNMEEVSQTQEWNSAQIERPLEWAATFV